MILLAVLKIFLSTSMYNPEMALYPVFSSNQGSWVKGLWKITAEKRALDGGKLSRIAFRTRRVINCAGNYSDQIDQLVPRTIDEPKPFTIKPGRGEYVVFEPPKGLKGPKGMVTQVPTKAYAGLYMFQSVYGHYAVGPTNVIQESKKDRGCEVDSVADLQVNEK